MRPFPHSSQGVHTYRNHAEIYRKPSRHVREINCGTKVGRRKPREGPTTGTGGFWEGYWSQSDIARITRLIKRTAQLLKRDCWCWLTAW